MRKVMSRKPYRMGLLFTVVVGTVLALTVGSVMAAGALVDINTADLKALESLPGIGPSMAKQIVSGRPYKTVDDLSNVKGIGKAKLEKIRPLVTVGGAPATGMPAAASTAASSAATKASSAGQAAKGAVTDAKKAGKAAVPSGPVNINSASMEQLESLPGIGPKKAQAIIDGRPYQKPEDIMKVKGIKEGIYGKIQNLITVK
jgi:competence protein ComEA